jgi:filamentous hemagglutinin family protein
MPTANRRQFVPEAIRLFLAQDYPERELIVVDDGDDIVADLIPDNGQIRYLRLESRHSTGVKRNLACAVARGEIIAHWDDDDWYAPWRLSRQVAAIVDDEADLCGLARMLFFDPSVPRAWEYIYPAGAPRWVYGATFCYRKSVWRQSPFLDVTGYEDNALIAKLTTARLRALPEVGMFVGLIHSANSSQKRTQDSLCRLKPVKRISRVVGSNWAQAPKRATVVEARPIPLAALSASLGAATMALGALTVTINPAYANPKGGQVSAGSAAINQTSPTRLDIVQSTDRAAIDWQSFSIAPNERTNFQQPSTSSMTLNRVAPGDPSVIAGRLTANGGVVLINPSGITFSKGSQVDVNTLIATPTDISNANFMAGRMKFDKPSADPRATVVNDGSITVAERGLAALVAPAVKNSGTIQAKLGKVVLGGAQTYTVDFYGDGLISFDVGPKVTSVPTGPDGQPMKSLVSNSGTIDAPGGTVLLSANAAAGIVENVVDLPGQITARANGPKPGSVVIDAGPGGRANLSGKIDVSGLAPGQSGGSATVSGGSVQLAGTAQIDARGTAGGGTVRVGGGPHGADLSARNAATTLVATGAVIDVSATGTGNGGQVTVWSDQATAFGGRIKARGGPNGGDGGWVETSSGDRLGIAASASVDTLSPNGNVGEWLLDPSSVLVTPGALTTLPNTLDTLTDPNSYEIDPIAFRNAFSSVTIAASGTVEFNNAGNPLNTLSMVNNGAGLIINAQGTVTVDMAITTTNGQFTVRGSSGTGASGAFTASQPISTGNAAIQIQSTSISINSSLTTSGNVALVATTGNAIENASGEVAAPGLIVNAPNGVVTFDGPNSVSTLSGVSRGAFQFTNFGTSTVGNVPAVVDVGPQSGVTTTAGDVRIRIRPDDSGNLVLANNISAGAGANNAALIAADITETGGVVRASGLIVNASGAVTFDTGPNAVGTLSGRSFGAFQFTNTSLMTVGTVPAVADVGTQSGVSAQGEVRIRTNTGDLVLASGVTAEIPSASPILQNAALVATAGNITETTGVVTASGLILNAGGSVIFDVPNAVGTLTGRAGAAFQFVNAGPLTVGTVGPVVDVPQTSPPTQSGIMAGLTTAGNVELATIAGNLSVDSNVTANGGGVLVGVGGAGNLFQTAVGTQITSTGTGLTGDIVILADTITFLQGTAITAGTTSAVVLAPFTSTRPINVGSSSTGATFGLTSLDLGMVTAGLLQIGDSAAGTISISPSVAINTGQTPNLALVTGGGVSQAAGATITAAASSPPLNLGIIALDSVVLGDLNRVDTLAGVVNGASPQSFLFRDDAKSLAVGALTVQQAGVSTASGTNFPVVSAAGSGSSSNPVSGVTTAGGSILLETTTSGDLVLNQPVNAMMGSVGLSSAGMIMQDPAPIIASQLAILSADHVSLGAFGGPNDANQVGTLAGQVLNFGESFVFRNDAKTLTIGTVNVTDSAGTRLLNPLSGAALTGPLSGVTTNIANIGLRVTSSGDLVLNANVNGGRGGIGLEAAGQILQTAGTLAGSSLEVSAAGPVSLPDTNAVPLLVGQVTGSQNSFSLDDGVTLTVGSVGPLLETGTGTPPNSRMLSIGGLSGIMTTNGNIALSAADLVVDRAVNAGKGSVSLASASGITQLSDPAAAITAQSLVARTGGDITLGNPANAVPGNVTLSTLDSAGTARGSGAVTFYDSTGFTIAAAGPGNGLNGQEIGINTSGDVTLQAGGALAETGVIAAPQSLIVRTLSNAGAPITLTNPANALHVDPGAAQFGIGGDVTLSALNAAGSAPAAGAISFISSTGFLILPANGKGLNGQEIGVNTASDVTLQAGGQLIGTASSIVAQNLVVRTEFDAGGAISLDGSANVVRGNVTLSALNAAATAPAPGAIGFSDTTGFRVVAQPGNGLNGQEIGVDTAGVVALTGGDTIRIDGAVGNPLTGIIGITTTNDLLVNAPITSGTGQTFGGVGITLSAANNVSLAADLISPINLVELSAGSAITQSSGMINAAGLAAFGQSISLLGPNAVDVLTGGPSFSTTQPAVSSFAFRNDRHALVVGCPFAAAPTACGVQTTGGPLTVVTTGTAASGFGLMIDGPVSSAGGPITLMAGGRGGAFANNSVINSTSAPAAAGDVTILADAMTLAAGTINAAAPGAAGRVLLGPVTTTDSIVLGGAGALGLTSADLASISAGVLQIGYRNKNGTPLLTGDINITAPITVDTTKLPTLLLVTGGNVTEAPGSFVTSTGGAPLALGVLAGGSVSMAQSNQVGVLAGVTDGVAANGFLFRNDGASLTVDSVSQPIRGVAFDPTTSIPSTTIMTGPVPNPLSGVTTNGGNIALHTTTAGDLILAQNLNANGAQVALVSTGNAREAGGTVAASGLILDAAGSVAFGIQETGNTVVFANPNAVGTVAGSAGGVFGFFNGGALTIGTAPSVLDVASQSGISASVAPAGDVLIQTNAAGQQLMLAGNISAGGRAILDSVGSFSQIGTANVSAPVLAIDTTGSGVGSLLSFIPSANVSASAIANLPPAGRTSNAMVFGGLQAPNSTVLLFTDRGVVNGAMNVGQLGLSGAGASADLNGSIGGVTGPNAALSGSRSPGPDPAYLFNGCIIAAASCGPPTMVQSTPTINLPPFEFLVVAPQAPDELSILTVVPNLTATLNLVTPQPVTAREQQDPDTPVINIFDEERLCTEAAGQAQTARERCEQAR